MTDNCSLKTLAQKGQHSAGQALKKDKDTDILTEDVRLP